MEDQTDKLGQIEYEEVLIDNISKLIVNRNYMHQNIEFWDNLVFKMWEEYYYGLEHVSIKKQAQFLEIFFYNTFTYKPSNTLPKDVLGY